MAKTQQTISLIVSSSLSCELLSNVPAELIAAQCIIESGWLDYAPRNNCFGIKKFDGDSGNQLLTTIEYFTPLELQTFLNSDPLKQRTAVLDPKFIAPHEGRARYIVKDWFATFDTIEDCFKQRAKLFDKGRYAPLTKSWRMKTLALEPFIIAIAKIYATSPDYGMVVLRVMKDPMIMKEFDMQRYDFKSGKEGVS